MRIESQERLEIRLSSGLDRLAGELGCLENAHLATFLESSIGLWPDEGAGAILSAIGKPGKLREFAAQLALGGFCCSCELRSEGWLTEFDQGDTQSAQRPSRS